MKRILLATLTSLIILTGCATTQTQELVNDQAMQDVDSGSISIGVSSQESATIALIIKNNTNFDFYEMYISSENNDSWGEDLLKGNVINQGASVTGSFNLSNNDTIWDIRLCDQDGNTLDFEGMNIENPLNRTSVTLEFDYSEENGYLLTIE